MTTTTLPGAADAKVITVDGRRPVRRHAAAFCRFAGLGSAVTLAASAALVLLSRWMPWTAANALTTLVSTVAATELHARVSFGGGRPGPAGHLRSAATVVLGWLTTSAAVAALAALRPGAGVVAQQTVYLSATALAGVGRYLLLRSAVFAAPTPQRAPALRRVAYQRGGSGTKPLVRTVYSA